MKPRAEPINYLWWLVSRASGIVALVLISPSVLMELAMAARVIRRPGVYRSAARLHEHVALTALVAIGAHGYRCSATSGLERLTELEAWVIPLRSSVPRRLVW